MVSTVQRCVLSIGVLMAVKQLCLLLAIDGQRAMLAQVAAPLILVPR
jgi:hypothetical protein